MPGPLLPTRRALLLGALGAGVITACGGSSEPEISSTAAAAADDDRRFLLPGFPDGFRAPPMLAAGVAQVVPIFLAGATGRPLRADEVPAGLELEIRSAGSVLITQMLPVRGAGIPAPHYSPLVDIDTPGDYTMAATIDGAEQVIDFRVVDRGELGLVQVGDSLRPVESPTTADARGVDPICTRQPDPCPFHELTVTEAIADPRPTVVLVSTPAFCQTEICGPVLDLLIDDLADHDDIVTIHAEVWRDIDSVLQADGATEVVTTYGLGYEPSMFVADGAGVVVARLDLAWDRDEQADALALIG